MSRLGDAWRRLRSRSAGAFERELREELELHVTLRTEDLQRSGLSAHEARRRARLEFGSSARYTEECREAAGRRLLDDLRADLRDAGRALRRERGFTVVATSVLASVLAANLVLFAFLDDWFLRPLPIEGAERHVELARVDEHGREGYGWSFDDGRAVLETGALETAYLFGDRRVRLGDDIRAQAGLVAGAYFELLRPRLFLGRAFADTDEDVALLSRRGWQRLTASDPDVLGRVLLVEGAAFTVVGVLDAGSPTFEPVEPELLLPARAAERTFTHPTRGRRQTYAVAGCLPAGVSPEQAGARLGGLLRRPGDERARVRAVPRTTLLRESREARPLALALLLAFALVTAVAGANLTNLHLARAAARRHDVALRLALGASRGRLLRQLLTESLVLAVLAAGLAWLLADAAVAVVQGEVFRLVIESGVAMVPVTLGPRVVLATFALATLVSSACGLLPALQATRDDVRAGLARDAPLLGGRLRAGSLRGALVVMQVAASFALVVVAGLLARNVARADRTDVGFDLDHLVDLRPEQPDAALLDALRAVPGVRAAGGISQVPLAGWQPRVEGRVGRTTQRLGIRAVDEQALALLDLVPRIGRGFRPEEAAHGAPVAVVSQATARLLWPGGHALGQAFEHEDEQGRLKRVEVIGVVDDIVSGFSFQGRDATAVYVPAAAGDLADVLVRVEGDPARALPALRQACRRAGTNCEPLPLRRVFRQQQFPFLAAGHVAGGLGALALGLACLGLYGLVSFAVVQRTREIGVRLALGATRGGVLMSVLAQSLRRVAWGVALGLPACLALSAFVASRVPLVQAFDAGAYLGAPLLLAVAALAAAYAPARRAAGVDPLLALRHD